MQQYDTTLPLLSFKSQYFINYNDFYDTSLEYRIGMIANKLKQMVYDYGYGIVINLPIDQFKTFAAVSALALKEEMTYTGGNNARENIGSGALSVGTEPPHVDVAPHNEMSYWTEYPEYILFCCENAPKGKGPTVISDNKLVTNDLLKTSLGKKFLDLGVTYVRNFHDACSNKSIPSLRSWQEAFGYQSKAEVKSLCENKGWEYSFSSKGNLKIIYTLPAFEFDPELKRNIFFTTSGCHGRSFKDWEPFNQLDLMDCPYHLLFGDGSEISDSELILLDKIFAKYSLPIYCEAGMLAMLHNRKFTHARPPFVPDPVQKRVIGVKFGNRVERFGQVNF